MSFSNLDLSNEDTLDATELDHSAVAHAMAEIDNILLASSRDALPLHAAHTDDEATRASAQSLLPSASSGVSESPSSVDDDIDALVPPTPDIDLPLDVAAILDLDGGRVSETPHRHQSCSSEEQHTEHPVSGGAESPRSFLARVKSLREHAAALSAASRSKKLLSPRRTVPLTPRRPSRATAQPM